MKHLRRLLLLFSCSPVLLPAQNLAPDDTLLFVLDRDIVVTASRFPVVHAPTPVEIFQSDEIELLPGRSVGDLLRFSSGTSLRAYGSAGSLNLASLRGLGAEYTIVMLNGIRLNDAQNALVDVGQLSLQNVRQLEIARGGFASLYGTDALGGVMNIRTSPVASSLSFSASVGSFGWKAIRADAGMGWSTVSLRTSGGYEESSNTYPFSSPHGSSGEALRRNADFIRRSMGLEGRWVAKKTILTVLADYRDSDAGIPGAHMSQSQGSARQRDQAVLLSASLNTRLHPELDVAVMPALVLAAQEYDDPAVNLGGQALRSRYENTSATLAATAHWKPSRTASFAGFVDVTHASLASAELVGKPARWTGAITLTGDVEVPFAKTTLRVYPSLRVDHVSNSPADDRKTFITPGLGARVPLIHEAVALRARIGRNFRIPTFNQLYWKLGGNPDLLPEYSTTFDGGVQWNLAGFASTVEATYFHHEITDKIVWMPGNGFWSPRNIQHVRSNGIELNLSGDVLGRKISYRINGQWMDSRKVNASFEGDRTKNKQLIYIPAFSASGMVTIHAAEWLHVALAQQFVGERFFQEDNSPSSRMEPYALTDIAVTCEISAASLQWKIKAEIMNVFDHTYEVVAFYPMPPRSARLTLTTIVP